MLPSVADQFSKMHLAVQDRIPSFKTMSCTYEDSPDLLLKRLCMENPRLEKLAFAVDVKAPKKGLLTVDGMAWLHKVTELRSLILDDNPTQLSEEGCDRLQRVCMNVEELHLRHCLHFGDRGLGWLSKMKNLRHLSVGFCSPLEIPEKTESKPITEKGIEEFATNHPEMETFELDGAVCLEKPQALACISKMTKLQKLHLGGNKVLPLTVASGVLDTIQKSCTKLHVLQLSHAKVENREEFLETLHKMQHLQRVELSHCSPFTKADKEQFVKALPEKCIITILNHLK